MLSGGVLAASGASGGGLIVYSSAAHIVNALTTSAVIASGGIALAFGTGILTIGLGIYAGYSLFKKGKEMTKEPEVREKLNSIMAKALKEYDRN
jgi:hypothetical protein